MEPEAGLIHLVYVSAATRHVPREELLAILEVARRKNLELGVTGILLYVDETFFQVLEGTEEAVVGLYDHIALDSRHERVLKLIIEPIEARAFPDWSMGYAALSRSDLESIPGLNDFFQSRETLIDLPESRARKLMESFAEGRWRARILP